MNSSVVRQGVFACLVLGLAGCGTLYEVDVSAHKKNESLPGNTYVILSNDQDIPLESPEFDQCASQLQRAMAEHGYRRVAADQLTDATIGVYLSAGISDPKKSYHTVSRGVYETPHLQTAPAAARSTSQGGGQSGQPPPPPTVLDRAPDELLTGVEKSAFATTVYTKHMSVIAVDLKKYLDDIQKNGRDNAVPQELWSVDVETTGSADDLYDTVPVMIAAAEPFLGDSTDKQVRVSLSEGDRRVRRIRDAAN